YQLHCDASGEEVDGIIETLEQLYAEGLIRGYGISTDEPEAARRFVKGPNCIAIQHDLNVLRDAQELLALCEQHNLASVSRSPLAEGLLSGKYPADFVFPADDFRGAGHKWIVYFENGRPSPAYLAGLAAVREILTSQGRSLVQGALAWIWARSDKTIPIPGFKTVAQVEENCAALAFGPLTPAQMAEIEQLLRREAQPN
ncbi:MAG TPA: aldo/keto reductase, partial [Caldilineaceae bacterium]|nr:aldo/keto reductase [Caldilineaceae bacterium]